MAILKPEPNSANSRTAFKRFLRNIRQRFSALERKICKRMPRRATDTAAQLMQLRQAHMIGVLDNQRIGIRNVNTCLNNCRAHKHINVAVTHGAS